MTEMMVELGDRRYPIKVGQRLLARLDQLHPVTDRRVLVVTDDNIAPLYLDTCLERLGADAHALVLPAGESQKTLTSLSDIWNELARLKLPRDGLLVALGGGVIGDMTGLAAATWMRGTPFLQLPTTLLAQVDASVGGKTAINLDAGKNLVGAFHQPEAVIIDTDTLATLPEREYAAGLAEVVKAAIISGEAFLRWLEEHSTALAARDPRTIEAAILRSCELKASVVAEDERESGRRAVLNLGHTFAHAIETGLGHGAWLHGEAVAAGLVLALRLSERKLGSSPNLSARILALLDEFGLPTTPPRELTGSTMLGLMAGDKKVDRHGLRFILAASCGDVRIVGDCREESILALFDDEE